jgi:mannose/fructose/N-acetylgalactosamine-specific phosphotransferase system component IID
MYLVVIAWIYVVLMMSVAEATNSTGTVLGAIITFLMYGVAPVALVVYLMRTPARRKTIKQREAEALARHQAEVDVPPAVPATTLPGDNIQKR